ncbi:hypothetical protein MJO28_010801 [Puccinia striiformis f. sp. tritici]|uniref:Uncharacterized protein n=1 Tax=Puccinia striiformis f. sp. tritici TaxID=168172 RepID=A0ACC0E6U8_9BASI|nr:hypothetical protein MJO28_010801 [Puccinia striiformis f. sp. tritici]
MVQAKLSLFVMLGALCSFVCSQDFKLMRDIERGPLVAQKYAESLPNKVGDLDKFTPHITLTAHQHGGRILWLFDNNGCLKDLKWKENFDWSRIYGLLAELCKDPRNEVWVTSGTNMENVEELYGHIEGLHLAAEHSVITKKAEGPNSIERHDAIQPDVPEIKPLREAAREIYLEYKNADPDNPLDNPLKIREFEKLQYTFVMTHKVIVGDAARDIPAEDVKKIERMHERLFKLTEEKRFADYDLLQQPDLGHLEFKHRKADKAHLPLDLLAGEHDYALAISVGDKLIDEGMHTVVHNAGFPTVVVSTDKTQKTHAQYRLDNHEEVYDMIEKFIELRKGPPPSE